MWSWIKRTCKRITDPVLNPIRRKLSRDWETLTLDNFKYFIENVGVVNVLGFYATLLMGVVGGIFTISNTFPVFTVWLMYVFFCIGIPNFFILLALVTVVKTIEKYQYQNGRNAVYWTGRRASRLCDISTKITIYVLVLYLIFVVIMALGYWAPAIFVGEYMYFMSALGSLVVGEIWWWYVWVMAIYPWINMGILNFKLRIVQAENVAMWNSRNRETRRTSRGSMEDWSDEDEILDFKLERLGL